MSCNDADWKRYKPLKQFFVFNYEKNLGNVCTLDASILVVLENDGSITPTGLNFNAQSPPSYYGSDLSTNAVRMACANIATTSAQACTACCKMACKHYAISVVSLQRFFSTNKIENINLLTIKKINGMNSHAIGK